MSTRSLKAVLDRSSTACRILYVVGVGDEREQSAHHGDAAVLRPWWGVISHHFSNSIFKIWSCSRSALRTFCRKWKEHNDLLVSIVSLGELKWNQAPAKNERENLNRHTNWPYFVFTFEACSWMISWFPASSSGPAGMKLTMSWDGHGCCDRSTCLWSC